MEGLKLLTQADMAVMQNRPACEESLSVAVGTPGKGRWTGGSYVWVRISGRQSRLTGAVRPNSPGSSPLFRTGSGLLR